MQGKSLQLAESLSNNGRCSSVSRSGDLMVKIATCFGAILRGRSGRDEWPSLLHPDTNCATMLSLPR
jgi:hypothetical protein